MVASIKEWWKKQDTEVSTDPSHPRSTEEFRVNDEGDDLVDRTRNIQGIACPLPTHDEIEIRAYQVFERNGRQEGQCQANWLQAEKELMEEKQNGIGANAASGASQSDAESEF
jgi:hypothetical protein